MSQLTAVTLPIWIAMADSAKAKPCYFANIWTTEQLLMSCLELQIKLLSAQTCRRKIEVEFTAMELKICLMDIITYKCSQMKDFCCIHYFFILNDCYGIRCSTVSTNWEIVHAYPWKVCVKSLRKSLV